MDYGRIAGNRIEGLKELSQLPCDMGWRGNGHDHPFLFAQARVPYVDDERTTKPIQGLAPAAEYEHQTEFDVYRDRPEEYGGFRGHGDEFPEDGEWEDPDEPPDEEEESSSSSSSSSSGKPEKIYDRIPLINEAIKVRMEIRQECKEQHLDLPDLSAWWHKLNCVRLGYFRDVELRPDTEWPKAELDAKRWGWFRPVRRKPDGTTVLPPGTRLVGRPLVGSYNKTWIAPPPEEGWSEQWQKEREQWMHDHPGEDPPAPPWEGHTEGGIYYPGDNSLRLPNEFGRCPVVQRAFLAGGTWTPVTVEREIEEDEIPPEESDSSSSSSSIPPDWEEDEEEEPPKTVQERVYVGQTRIPNPGFENPYRAAETWALVPLLVGCEGSVGEDFDLPDYDLVYDLRHSNRDPVRFDAPDTDPDPEEEESDGGEDGGEEDEDEESDGGPGGYDPEKDYGLPFQKVYHKYRKGEYDWRFFCGLTERVKKAFIEDEEGHRVCKIERHTFHPLWWDVDTSIATEPSPWDTSWGDGVLGEVACWAHCSRLVPWGTRVDVMVEAYVYGMKISKAIADRLRARGYVRDRLNPNSGAPKNEREWWWTHTRYRVRIRQHLPLS